MKTLLFCLSLWAGAGAAQAQIVTNAPITITNTLKVVLSLDIDAVLDRANKVNNYTRTNAVPPLPALSNKDFQELIAAEALAARAEVLAAQDEAGMLREYRAATPNQRAKARDQILGR